MSNKINSNLLTFETIVSTVNNKDVQKHIVDMNIDTHTIVVNQEKDFRIDEYINNDKRITCLTTNERGVGLSRNTGFMRSKEDICIIADDDMVYRKGYLDEIKKAYDKFPEADIICFSLNIIEGKENKVKQLKTGKLRRYESLKIGTPMITFKRRVVQKNLLSFSLLFGGGSIFGSGEDTLFIQEAYRKNLKIYQFSSIIADVYNDDSSWFKGYNDKFFFDKGALYTAVFPQTYKLMMLQFLIRKRKLFNEWKIGEAYKKMLEGSKFFRKNDF